MEFISSLLPQTIWFCGVSLLLLLTTPLRAQDSIRPSLAGQADAASQKKVIDTTRYNLKLGPVLFNLSANLDLQYTDNVSLAETNRSSDLIFEPFVRATALWQVSETNSLTLDLGVGYIKYLEHPQFDSFSLAVSPNSILAFNIYVGDFRFTIFDRFSVLESPLDDINLTNVANFPRLQNAVGLNVTWDLNRLIVLGGYSHYTFYSLGSQSGLQNSSEEPFFDAQNRSEEQFFLSADFKLTPAMKVGLRGTFASVNYTENFQPASLNSSVGPYLEVQLTPYMTLDAEVGYQSGSFSEDATNHDGSQLSTYYWRLELSHRLNRYWIESLIAGRESQLGFTTNFTEVTYVRYSASWRVNSGLTLNLNAFYEHGDDSAGNVMSEKIDRYGCGFSFARQLSRRIDLRFSYDFVNRTSDLPDRSYYQNRVLLGLSYAF